MNARLLGALAFLVTVASWGCSTPRGGSPAPAYTLVYLKTGPADGAVVGDERNQAFAGHMSNMQRMARERQLVVAGPFGKERHDPALRGLFVMNTGDRARATAWASTDPTSQRGVFVLEYHDFACDAPILAALERELARESQAKAEGRTLDPAASLRSYVLLTAEHGDIALRELGPLVGDGGVFLLGTLDGTRAAAWLDAQSTAEAQAKFAGVLARLGAHTLDLWHGSSELTRLASP